MEKGFDEPRERIDWRELENPRYGEIEEIEDELEKRLRLFKNFDIIEDPPRDHRFITNDHRKDIYQTDAMRSIILKERNILKDGLLPGSLVFVRSYRTRPDLMRAVIIGSQGTPFCNGLFFFDIVIPCKYPSQPPEICYLYHGVEINPYLYRNGKVSIDLLNSGFWNRLSLHKHQKWNPESSSVLQVLISIEKSVLKSDSYPSLTFPLNTTDGHGSLNQQKPVFTDLCKSMLEMLQHPPVGFKVLLSGHFRKQSHSILMTCKAIMDIPDDEDPMNHELFWYLIKAFEANGSYCRHHYTSSQEIESPKSSNGINRSSEESITYNQGQHEGFWDETTYRRRMPSQSTSFKQHLLKLLL